MPDDPRIPENPAPEDVEIAEALRRDAELNGNPDLAITLKQLDQQIRAQR